MLQPGVHPGRACAADEACQWPWLPRLTEAVQEAQGLPCKVVSALCRERIVNGDRRLQLLISTCGFKGAQVVLCAVSQHTVQK